MTSHPKISRDQLLAVVEPCHNGHSSALTWKTACDSCISDRKYDYLSGRESNGPPVGQLRNFFTLAGWGLNWIFMSNATRSAFRLLVMLPTEAQVSSGQSWEGIMSGCKCPGQVSMGKCPNTNTCTSLNWRGRLISLNSHDSRSIMKSMIGVLHTVISKQIIYSHLTKTNAEKFIREFALRCQNYPRLRTK